ncbi:SemiSWEET family transporter [Crossiella sp. CA-258035]|uniref:SemiSWEET family sugar transporter n=1 Tax=Crossiella sp. CA-258035 TaxID=2981138 RepID=UPI0024BD3ABB|nr:SemiSWEET family transporter [Crossiella sp. CA-258035]WHT18191.1 SemiSWEET family transporter [Crossiella sp. CA-258035]
MITLIGALAGVLTTACWLPQVVRCLKRRSARDFSWVYLVALGSGVFCWVLYGIGRADTVIIATNSLTLLLLSVLVAVKLRTELGRDRVLVSASE